MFDISWHCTKQTWHILRSLHQINYSIAHLNKFSFTVLAPLHEDFTLQTNATNLLIVMFASGSNQKESKLYLQSVDVHHDYSTIVTRGTHGLTFCLTALPVGEVSGWCVIDVLVVLSAAQCLMIVVVCLCVFAPQSRPQLHHRLPRLLPVRTGRSQRGTPSSAGSLSWPFWASGLGSEWFGSTLLTTTRL